jgi:hypothetical protein
MPVTAGPNITEDGLVLYIDPGNQESWSGPDASLVNSLKGNITGSIVNDTSGSYGLNNSFDFDGTDDIINTNINPRTLIGNNSSYSVSIWVYYSGASGGNYFLGSRYSSGQFWFGIYNTKPIFSYGGVYYQTGMDVEPLAIPGNQWSQIVFTYDASSEQHKIYISNIQSPTFTPSGGNAPQTVIDSVNIAIGGYPAVPGIVLGQSFNGDIGPTQIYNKALSAAEVTQNYNALKGRFGL